MGVFGSRLTAGLAKGSPKSKPGSSDASKRIVKPDLGWARGPGPGAVSAGGDWRRPRRDGGEVDGGGRIQGGGRGVVGEVGRRRTASVLAASRREK